MLTKEEAMVLLVRFCPLLLRCPRLYIQFEIFQSAQLRDMVLFRSTLLKGAQGAHLYREFIHCDIQREDRQGKSTKRER